MGLSVSLLLIAVGLILALAIHAATGVADVDVIGWILVAVGAFGVLLNLMLMGHRDSRWSRWY